VRGRDELRRQLHVREPAAAALLIDGGYHVAQFAAFGLVLGLWPS
jgi:hypothetical protein